MILYRFMQATYIFIHYWNNYVVIMHDTDKIEINITHKLMDFLMIHIYYMDYTGNFIWK